jgi:hypothetical protein
MATPQEVFKFASEEASRQGVPVELVQNIIQAESGGNIAARSNKGAQGPMQLMPATAKELGVNINDWRDNVRGGVQYIGKMLNQFQDPTLAVAAYNAGPGNVRKYDGIPPFKETQNYVKKVTGMKDNEFVDVKGISTQQPIAQQSPTQSSEFADVTGIGTPQELQKKQSQGFFSDVATGFVDALRTGPTARLINRAYGGSDAKLNELMRAGGAPESFFTQEQAKRQQLAQDQAPNPNQRPMTIGQTFGAIRDVAMQRPGLLAGSLLAPDITSLLLPTKIAGATERLLKTTNVAPRAAERTGAVAGAAGTGVAQAAINQATNPNAQQFQTDVGMSLLTAPLGAIGTARTPRPEAPLSTAQVIASNAVRDGYVMSPTSLSPTVGRGALEKSMGKSDFAATASVKNVDLATNQAKSVIGLAPDQQLTADAFRAFRQDQGNAYQALRNFDYKTDRQFVNNLNDEIQNLRSLTTTQPEQINTLRQVAKTNIKGDDLVNNIIDLRDAGNTNLKSADAAKKRLGRTQLKVAKELEDVADRFLANTGNPDLVSQFRQARQNIAQSYTVEGAFDAANNIIDPRRLSALARKDQPIPDQLRTAALAANTAPAMFTPQKNWFGGRSPGVADVATGLGAGFLTGNPLVATAAVARPTIREILTSGPAQRAMIPRQPMTGPMQPTAPRSLTPYLATTPFQPVTQGLFEYINQ